ncbi:MAG TPA: carboxypeptidase regulatory-like domain-containing protein [Pyrinomonadaceae bacterium]|nr:carboxypeptidase regulatory-like domain-containing protein [Pyrinomonadaceae bacterium]
MFTLKHRAPSGGGLAIHCHWFIFLIGCLAALVLSPAAVAQSVSGSISGMVTDPNGSVVPGANLTLVNDQTKARRDQVSNESGRFNFASIQPGIYSLKIEHQGFETLLRTNVVLSANEDLALGELRLKTGQVTETVTVSSEGAIVEKESTDLTARLTADQLSLISTKGRDITSLLRLIPGTSNDDDIEAVGEGFGTNLPNISGQRGRSTVTTIDGLNASEPSGSNKISMTINQDAVGEIKVLRNNYAAEYGNNGGAMITIVSKGGGTKYRGSAYYFVRNESLNANNFFINKASTVTPATKPIYRHKIPGFNFSGPLPLPMFGETGRGLVRDKAFFFVSMEKPHTITPTDPVTVTVPTALERKGDFSKSMNSSGNIPTILDPLTGLQFPGNVIPDFRINKSMQNLLNFFPLPNSPTASNPGRYIFQKSVDVPKHSYVFRFDVKPGSKDSFYWKGQWWTSDNEGLGTSGWPSGDANRWGISSHYLYKDNGWSGNWVHIFNSKIVNEFYFGMRHDSEGFIPSAGVAEGLTRSAVGYTAPQIFPKNNELNLVPIVNSWTTVAGTPANINWLNRWGETGNDYIRPSFSDNLSVTHGVHTFKFGAYFERLLNSEAPGGNWSGTLSFASNSSFATNQGNTGYAYSNALLGNFNSYSEQSSRPFTNNEIHVLQMYAQDDWRMSRRVTMNYGLRVGYHTPFFQRDDQGANFDPSRFNPARAPLLYLPTCTAAITAVACPTANRRAFDPRTPTVLLTNTNLVGTFVPGTGDLANGMILSTDPNAPPGFRRTRSVDLEPRVGIAWDLTGEGKTVLRLMGGVYHSPRVGGGTGGASSLGGNPPLQRSFTVNFGNVENLLNLIGGALNSPSTVAAVEVNSKTPTTFNYTIGIQRDIGFKTVAEVAYVGSQSRHLGERRNINQVPDNAHFIDLNPFGPNCLISVNAGCTRNPFANSSINGVHTLGVLGDNFLRPYKGYGDINQTTWSGNSNYNALHVQVNRRYTKGFQYGVAYTYSKTLDYANDDSSDVNSGRPYRGFNYGPADFDQAHILTGNYIYDLPNVSRHWNNKLVKLLFDNYQISGTTSYVTGKPKTGISTTYSGGSYTISAGQTYLSTGLPCAPGFALASGSTTSCTYTGITDFTGGDINARSLLLCDPNVTAATTDNTGLSYAINPACFGKPLAQGDIGTLGRNAARLPSIFNNDVAIFKNIKLGEKREVQLRWEVYNVFNHANFKDIDGSMTFAPDAAVTALAAGGTCPAGTVVGYAAVGTNPARCTSTKLGTVSQTNNRFGAPTSARSARVMQGSIRINF